GWAEAGPEQAARRDQGVGTAQRAPAAACGSDVETEQDDVPVLHDVVLALAAHQAALFGHGHRAALHQLVKADDLRPDEAPLEVGVDLARRLGGLGALCDGPGPDLGLSGGEVGNEP